MEVIGFQDMPSDCRIAVEQRPRFVGKHTYSSYPGYSSLYVSYFVSLLDVMGDYIRLIPQERENDEVVS